MRAFILGAAASVGWLLPAFALEPAFERSKAEADAMYRELGAGIPKGGARATSARLELEYCRKHPWCFLSSPVRQPVRTTDGTDAEVVFLRVPALSMPGTDFSMAFLLAGGRVI